MFNTLRIYSELQETLNNPTETQKWTEKTLRQLAGEHKQIRKQLGGLTMMDEYMLEDQAYGVLPKLLKRDYGIILPGRIHRRYVKDNRNKDIEVNIIGEGKKDGKVITVVGESKSQLSKNDVDRFVKNKLNRLENVFPELFPVLITYMTSKPDTEEYAKNKGIALYFSYDLVA